MDQLDADVKPLYSRVHKQFMARDIVQFVPFLENKHDPMKLAREVLNELPRQVVEFFISKGITPKPAKEAERQALKNQLSMKSAMQNGQKLDAFIAGEKQEFIEKCRQMGYDVF